MFGSESLVHPDAIVHESAKLDGCTVVGPGVKIGEDTVLQDTILWPQSKVLPGANLTRCIVRSGMKADGQLVDADI